MKNIYKLFLAVLVLVGFTACEDERFTIDPNGTSNVLVTFASTNINLPVVIDDAGSVTVDVNVTTSSTSDRTFNLSVDAASSSADPVTFSVPATVTIPAGSFTGSFTITGTDLGVETTPESIVIDIMDTDDILTAASLTVNIFQICPIPADAFLGAYTVTTNVGGTFGAGVFGPTGGTVTLAGSGTERTFSADYIADAGFGTFTTDFSFNFVCNEIVVGFVDTGIGCGATPANLEVTNNTDGPGVYDATDDSSFTVVVIDDLANDCNGATVSSYTFTKN